jgi:hypothetical protein
LIIFPVQQQEEETARIRKEMKGKTPIKLQPKSVGGHRISHQESIEHQQRLADKSPTAKALEMRVYIICKQNFIILQYFVVKTF